MQRDKRGRFIKKATDGMPATADGTQVTVNGKTYKIKPGAQTAFNEANTTGTYSSIMDWFNAGYGAEYLDPVSAGLDFYDTNKSKFKFDWLKASDFLEGIRAGVGMHVNKKMAERALEAEKPFLQTISEDYKPVYGNYRAKVLGEQAAAQFRNAAAVPLTSDGALQLQAMLEAQIKGLEYINLGNAADDSTIRLTLDAAQAQRKANRENRQSVASANRQAMLMTAKNKADIENGLASANYSQIVSPLMLGIELRMRNDELKLRELRTKYQKSLIEQDVWNGTGMTLTPEQEKLRSAYLDGGIESVNTLITKDPSRQAIWRELNRLMQREILRRHALLDGITLDTSTSDYGMFTGDESLFKKKGGSIYKAKLVARSKDNDRAARSIESSKKLAARLLEKVLDSLYTYKDVELVGKSKKRKYLGGGGIPFVGFTPVFATSERGEPVASKEESKKDSDKDLTTKDILTLLKDMDGLPSDMQVILSSLQNFAMSSDMDPLQTDSSANIASRYMRVIGLIKMAKFNKDEYNSALNQLKGNGGLNEYAITSEGLLIGTNKEGDYKYFTVEDVKDGKLKDGDYSLLTNSNLLYLRANSPDAAFNHKLTTVAQNGIGMLVVNQMINNAITKLGSTTSSQEGYISTKQGELISGLEHFYEAVKESGGNFDGSVLDLYKYKYLTKTQAELVTKAIRYLYTTLPENARTLLKLKSDGSEEGAITLISTLLASREEPTVSFDITLDKSGKKGSGSGSDDDKYYNHLFRAAMGEAEQVKFNINPGTSNFLEVTGTAVPIMESSSDIIKKDLLSEVKSSTFGLVLKTSSMSIAGQHIDSSVANKVYLKSRRAIIADLPYTTDDLGNIIPDYKLLEQKDLVDNYVKNNNLSFEKDFAKIQEFIKINKFKILFNKKGEVQYPDVLRFALFNANFPEDIFIDNKIKNGKYVSILSSTDAEATYQAIMDLNGWTTKDWDYDVTGLFADSMYAGTVAIPIDSSFLNMVTKDLDSASVSFLGKVDKENKARENFNYDTRQLGQ